jgi:hypothetical protein
MNKKIPACSCCIHHDRDYIMSILQIYIAGATKLNRHLCGAQGYVECKEVYGNQLCKDAFWFKEEKIPYGKFKEENHETKSNNG